MSHIPIVRLPIVTYCATIGLIGSVTALTQHHPIGQFVPAIPGPVQPVFPFPGFDPHCDPTHDPTRDPVPSQLKQPDLTHVWTNSCLDPNVFADHQPLARSSPIPDHRQPIGSEYGPGSNSKDKWMTSLNRRRNRRDYMEDEFLADHVPPGYSMILIDASMTSSPSPSPQRRLERSGHKFDPDRAIFRSPDQNLGVVKDQKSRDPGNSMSDQHQISGVQISQSCGRDPMTQEMMQSMTQENRTIAKFEVEWDIDPDPDYAALSWTSSLDRIPDHDDEEDEEEEDDECPGFRGRHGNTGDDDKSSNETTPEWELESVPSYLEKAISTDFCDWLCSSPPLWSPESRASPRIPNGV